MIKWTKVCYYINLSISPILVGCIIGSTLWLQTDVDHELCVKESIMMYFLYSIMLSMKNKFDWLYEIYIYNTIHKDSRSYFVCICLQTVS